MRLLQSVGNNSSNFLAGPLLADDDMGDVMGPIVLTVRDGTPLQLTVDQFQRMTWHELMRIWKVIHPATHPARCPPSVAGLYHS